MRVKVKKDQFGNLDIFFEEPTGPEDESVMRFLEVYGSGLQKWRFTTFEGNLSFPTGGKITLGR